MTHRLLTAPLLTAMALVVLPHGVAHAAPDAAAIQAQLQSEWDDFLDHMNGAVTSTGKLNVTSAGTGYRATLPLMTVRLQTNNSVMLENATILATPTIGGSLNLKLTLPTTIPQFYGQQETGRLTIGQQNITIGVKPAGDTWQVQSLDGTLGQLVWQQNENITSNPLAPVQATLQNLTIAGKPSQLHLTAQNLSLKTIGGETQMIGAIDLAQQPANAQSLRLSDVLALLANTVPQLENNHGGMAAWLQGAASMTAHVQNIKNLKPDGTQSLAIADMNLQNALADSTAGKLTLRTTGKLTGIAVAVPAAFANTAPQAIDFTGTVRNMPANYFSMPFNTPEAQERSRQALTAAGTQLQIDSLNVTTKGGLKANGTGLLTASNTPPAYATGLITLNISNLQDTLTQLQQQMKSGSGMAGNPGQAMMALMLLQGMGKANGNQTQYVIKLNPNGQILLNDQDLSGLMGMAGINKTGVNNKGAAPARALPVAPVTSTDTSSGMSRWKE